MKKIITIIAATLLFSLSLCGQTINTVFKTVPNSVLWELSNEQKDKLLREGSDSLAFVEDGNLYERVQRTGFSNSFISLRTSNVGSVQIKLLPLVNDSKIVCVIKTVCSNICDSDISFYTSSWVPIKQTDLFPELRIESFIRQDINKDSDDFKNAITVLDINPIKLALSPDNDTIRAELDIKNYLDSKDYQKLLPFLLENGKTLTWDRTSFK